VYSDVSLLSTEQSAVTCVVVGGRCIHLFSWLVIFYVVRLLASWFGFSCNLHPYTQLCLTEFCILYYIYIFYILYYIYIYIYNKRVPNLKLKLITDGFHKCMGLVFYEVGTEFCINMKRMSVRFQNKPTSHFGTVANFPPLENCWQEATVRAEGREIGKSEDFP
jgi:hypothetical protein